MKKLNSTNRYIEGFEHHSDGKLSLYCINDEVYKLLLHRLYLFADAADSGIKKKLRREFTYTSDDQLRSVTFGLNYQQAINVLREQNFFTVEESEAIIKNSEQKKYQYSSVLDCLKGKKKKPKELLEDEQRQFLLKKE